MMEGTAKPAPGTWKRMRRREGNGSRFTEPLPCVVLVGHSLGALGYRESAYLSGKTTNGPGISIPAPNAVCAMAAPGLRSHSGDFNSGMGLALNSLLH